MGGSRGGDVSGVSAQGRPGAVGLDVSLAVIGKGELLQRGAHGGMIGQNVLSCEA
jgi:hypothetical protein